MDVPEEYRPTEDRREAYNRCNPNEPLRGDALEYWYVECGEARGDEGLVQRLTDRVVYPEGSSDESTGPSGFGSALLSGHRGCGKSTELEKVRQQLEAADYMPLMMEAHTEIQPDNLDTEAVIMIIMKNLVDQLAEGGIQLGESKVRDVTRWFAEQKTEFDELKETQVEAGAGAGAAMHALLATFNVLLKAHMKRGTAERTTSTVRHRKYLSDLQEHLNDLLTDAHLKVQEQHWGQTQIVLIIDGLDRIDDEDLQQEVFISFRELLCGLRAHLVMTVPIDLVCSPESSVLYETFGHIERMPCIRVETDDGLQTAREIITRRCSEDLFEDGVIDFICHASGGDVRDIMMTVREAILRSRPAEHITMHGAREAFYAMARAFSSWLQPAHYDRLVEHHGDPEDLQGSIAEDMSGQLLFSSALLGYSNDENWYRVHPAIRGLEEYDVDGLPQFCSRLAKTEEETEGNGEA